MSATFPAKGDTGQIIARWQHPVASRARVALDLPHWAMRLASYRLIRMAIKMASEAAAFFYGMVHKNKAEL